MENYKPLLSVCVIASNSDIAGIETFLNNIPKDPRIQIVILENVPITDNVGERFDVIQNYDNLKYLKFHYHRLNFADLRNRCQAYATGRWILSLDLDEVLPMYLFLETLDMLEHIDSNIDGFKIGIASSIRDLKNGGNYARTVYEQIKLFRNKTDIYYKSVVHELVEWTIDPKKVGTLSFNINHIGYDISYEEMIKKYERNIHLMGLEIFEIYETKRKYGIENLPMLQHFLDKMEVSLKTLKELKSLVKN